MTPAERERLATAYRRLPAYCHIYDPACMHLHFAHLASDADVMLRISTPSEIRCFEVRSATRLVPARAEGTDLCFSTGPSGPRYFIVRVDFLPPLLVAVEDPPSNPGDRPLDAGEFLTESSDHTEGFRRAFAAVNGTGRTLVIPPGSYSVSQLHIRDGRRFGIHLSPGCLIRVRAGAPGSNEHRHGLWLDECEDITLSGPGCVDHQAYQHYALAGNNYQDGMVDYFTPNDRCPWITQSPLFITHSRRIRVEGLVLRNGRNFNVNLRGCDDVTIRRVKVLTPAACTPEYADGINTGSSRNVLVEDCLVASNDDTLASGHYFSTADRRPSANHAYRRVLGLTLRGSGFRLGFFADHDQGDFTFEDCTFLAISHTSILVHALRDRPDGTPARYGTIRVSRCRFEAGRLQCLCQVDGAALDRLELSDVEFLGDPPLGIPVIIQGHPSAHIGYVSFRGISVGGLRLRSFDGFQTKVNGVREFRMV
jgi:Glycosyl hydrolases family 28